MNRLLRLSVLLLLGELAIIHPLVAQSIADFVSLPALPQDPLFHLPSTHIFQALIQTGDTLADGNPMPPNPDFTGYIPINGSVQGYLAVNSESNPGGVSVLKVELELPNQLWRITDGNKVDFSALASSQAGGTVNNCSGAVTPWGTMISSEEVVSNMDLNGDGYFDWGWQVEIDPVTHSVIDHDQNGTPDKLWALGHFKHENLAIAPDLTHFYEGEELLGGGYLVKFLADTTGNLSQGSLFALQVVGHSGGWIPIPNQTQYERNHTDSLLAASGATPFDRIEDVEVGPDGKVYFTSTTQGRIFRFRDFGAVVGDFEVFVENGFYTIPTADSSTQALFEWPDNLAFDAEGNLWVTQDGGQNHIWVVSPNHSDSVPAIKVFANTPLGCEPTGINFSPDGKYLFLSIQHPNGSNSLSQIDAEGQPITFNKGTTLVVARTENLGSPIGINDPSTEINPLRIHPNPSNDLVEVTLELPISEPPTWTLTDILGKKCLEGTLPNFQKETKFTISLHSLPAGIYLLHLKTQSQNWTARLLKI